MSSDHDLSPYEAARLERIRRNEEKLRSLGLLGSGAVNPKALPRKKAQPRKRPKQTQLPSRSSKRLRLLKEGVKEEDENNNGADSSEEEANAASSAPEDDTVTYANMPQEPDHLDDSEFQVYVALWAWRLRRKNELEVEAYKVCQNRTLCELIRKRRNDNEFASSGKGEDVVEQDLLSVWGIGPSKATPGGFGWEMLEVMNAEENMELLQISRENSPKKDD